MRVGVGVLLLSNGFIGTVKLIFKSLLAPRTKALASVADQEPAKHRAIYWSDQLFHCFPAFRSAWAF